MDNILTVRELNFKLNQVLEARFPYIWIKGEVTNCVTASSGHVYFSLKEEQDLLNCVWFKHNHRDLAFDPLTGECFEEGNKPCLAKSLHDGQEIICAGKLAIYGARGQYQLIIEHAIESGIGQLHEAFEKLKQKLSHEGLFDTKYKKNIPAKIRNIALITAPTGAVIHDFLRIAQSRGIKSSIHIFPSLVQGDEAPQELISALKKASEHIFPNKMKADCIVFIRGGGSIQDLWAFNDETLARAIFSCEIPVVTGIGHEPDFSIADYVSDKSLATPSHVAQFLWKDKNTLIQELDTLEYSLQRFFWANYQHDEKELASLAKQLKLLSPQQKLTEKSAYLVLLSQHLNNIINQLLENNITNVQRINQKISRHEPAFALLQNKVFQLKKEISLFTNTTIIQKKKQIIQFQTKLQQNFTAFLKQKEFQLKEKQLMLEGNNPHKPLEKGYLYAEIQGKEQKIVKSIHDVRLHDTLTLHIIDGTVHADIKKINPVT